MTQRCPSSFILGCLVKGTEPVIFVKTNGAVLDLTCLSKGTPRKGGVTYPVCQYTRNDVGFWRKDRIGGGVAYFELNRR